MLTVLLAGVGDQDYGVLAMSEECHQGGKVVKRRPLLHHHALQPQGLLDKTHLLCDHQEMEIVPMQMVEQTVQGRYFQH